MSMISEQIEFLRSEAEYEYHVSENKLLADTLSQAAETIEALSEKAREPKQDEWIPCSERLPDDGGLWLVTVKCKSNGGYTIYYRDLANTMHRNGIEWYRDGRYASENEEEEIVAWMPLPTEYRGERNGKKKR